MGTRQKTQTGFHTYVWVLIWGMASVIPFIPYSQPLWIATLSDTPYSYLVWVPAFAFVWAGWSIWRHHTANDDSELSYMLGLVLAVFVGILLVVGRLHWDLVFVGHSVGLLFWPVWSLAMAWWIFGIKISRVVWRPLVYLLLCWPVLYSQIVHWTNPILDAIANAGVQVLTRWFDWISIAQSSGNYTVLHKGISTLVHVTSVCNGADSFLAMIILLPIIMVSYSRGPWKKLLLVVLAAVLAILGNVIRLWLILFTLHWFGVKFSLGLLHPILGVLLFLVMMGLVIWTAKLLQLRAVSFKRSTPLQRPGVFRLSSSVLSVAVLTFLLWPLLLQSPGTVRHPVLLQTSVLEKLMPPINGWHRGQVHNFNEASTLGPGAKTSSAAYTTIQGDYALTEMWWTYQPLTLKGYSEHNCLLFHGSKIIATEPMKLDNGITANVYAIYLPPLHVGGNRDIFLDTVYEYNATYRGKKVYIRMETAAPVLLHVKPSAATTQSVKELAAKLVNRKYNQVRHIDPVSVNQTVHLHNYIGFIRQMGATLLSSSNASSSL
ncbi:exosortase/archaeosortase family protein [Alicyclobacillus sp. SO9]|uniref:exosortase/archaeosortase family protein n=1 Tax=Alicyclobacillus sp. SO9 TaxID=2665646 RepID=UPI0018E765D1|nr:exosortase/archaeosortase family protein [Alicyclobacillus sp. SO9]QQE79321.1 exosortase/archaeosortase family protein [Alicyclobacillus sp. SO9]